MAKSIEEGKIYYLSPKTKILWTSKIIALAFFLWLFISWFAQFAFPSGLFGIPINLYYITAFMAIGIVLLPFLFWIELRYRCYTYCLSENEIIIRKGIVRIDRITIPFEKIQNINISRSILERLLNIATIKIETAGANPGEAEGIIPGVEDYRSLVDQILDRVEHVHRDEPRTSEASERFPEMKKIMDELTLLKQELKKIREEKKDRIENTKKENASKLREHKPSASSVPLLDTDYPIEKYKKDKKKRLNSQKIKNKKKD